MHIVDSDQFYIEWIVDDQLKGYKWDIIGVYTNCDVEIWNDQFISLANKLWHYRNHLIIFNDFNSYLHFQEKKRGNRYERYKIYIFKCFLDDLCLIDLGFRSHSYIWNNKDDGHWNIQERIGRFVIAPK